MYCIFCFLSVQNQQHTHTHPALSWNSERQRSPSSNLRDCLCWFMRERFCHATQDEANEWNVKILRNSKNKAAQGLPFEEIIGTRSGVEQTKQTVLYTQQQQEQSCQMSSAENRPEWVLQMFMYLTLYSYLEIHSHSPSYICKYLRNNKITLQLFI